MEEINKTLIEWYKTKKAETEVFLSLVKQMQSGLDLESMSELAADKFAEKYLVKLDKRLREIENKLSKVSNLLEKKR